MFTVCAFFFLLFDCRRLGMPTWRSLHCILSTTKAVGSDKRYVFISECECQRWQIAIYVCQIWMPLQFANAKTNTQMPTQMPVPQFAQTLTHIVHATTKPQILNPTPFSKCTSPNDQVSTCPTKHKTQKINWMPQTGHCFWVYVRVARAVHFGCTNGPWNGFGQANSTGSWRQSICRCWTEGVAEATRMITRLCILPRLWIGLVLFQF